MPSWKRNEQVTTANTEFTSAVKADPFEGAAVVNALASVIRATEGISGRVDRAKISGFILDRIGIARDAAINASDPAYALIFESQLNGLEAAQRILQAPAEVPKKPTKTSNKKMSDAKS